jgi:hypothetical protein
MQLQILTTIALAAFAAASPALERRAALCPSGQNAVCCQTDVDGVADLTCSTGKLSSIPAHHEQPLTG